MIRFFKHLLHFSWQDTWLTKEAIDQLEAATIAGERGHSGEIRLVIERKLPLSALKDSLRTRAERHFASLGLWNTEGRNGILIYLNLAERRLELVADTAINQAVDPSTWSSLCEKTIQKIKTGEVVLALSQLIEAIAMLLRQHFAQDNSYGDQLPNRPIVLG